MFEKIKLKKKIRNCKKRITDWEQKRTRSQAALMEAILTKSEPTDKDVDYFNLFSTRTDTERKLLQKYTEELEALEKKEPGAKA